MSALIAASACNRGAPRAAAATEPATSAPAARVDAGPPADRTAVRRVATLYHWVRTEAGNEGTHGEAIEHGTQRLHLVFEVHRDPEDRGWITVAALPGSVEVPENLRMRVVNPTSSQWHVPRAGYTEYSLEQFGGEVRSDEPIRVFLARAPDNRQDVGVAPEPQPVRLPAATTLPASSQAAVGRYDAIAVALVPVTARRGGRYLLYAVDFLPQPAGFAANGVMTRLPSADEIQRYALWLRDPSRIGHSNPPIPMQPIDR